MSVETLGRGNKGNGLVLVGGVAIALAGTLAVATKRVPAPPCTPTPAEVACHQKLQANCALLNPKGLDGIIPANEAQKTALEVAQGVCRSLNDVAPQCGRDYCTAAAMTDNALLQLFNFPE